MTLSDIGLVEYVGLEIHTKLYTLVLQAFQLDQNLKKKELDNEKTTILHSKLKSRATIRYAYVVPGELPSFGLG